MTYHEYLEVAQTHGMQHMQVFSRWALEEWRKFGRKTPPNSYSSYREEAMRISPRWIDQHMQSLDMPSTAFAYLDESVARYTLAKHGWPSDDQEELARWVKRERRRRLSRKNQSASVPTSYSGPPTLRLVS